VGESTSLSVDAQNLCLRFEIKRQIMQTCPVSTLCLLGFKKIIWNLPARADRLCLQLREELHHMRIKFFGVALMRDMPTSGNDMRARYIGQ